jgi:pimeloyl-ACP methyl ester carboxylesterase
MSEEYQRIRQREIHDVHDKIIGRFLDKFDPDKETIVFLPGGMGSQLCVSQDSVQPDEPFDNIVYPVAWLDLGILFENDLEKLQINRTSVGSYQDMNDHIVIPHGELRLLVKPYNQTREYFVKAGFNYVVYGFDWRRSSVEGAEFLNYFLEQFRRRTIDQFGANKDPLPNVTLVGHSQGGLILHTWLLTQFRTASNTGQVRTKYKKTITVGTPFYGTSTHLQRYFDGENYFNQIFGKDKVRGIIASMPGLYILMTFDEQSYDLKKDVLGLRDYPLKDENENNMDPFNRQNEDAFPGWATIPALREAARLRNALSQNLNRNVCNSVYNIYATGKSDTAVALRWDKTKSPNDEPVDTLIEGKGDGTVPYWSGRLADVPNENTFDLTDVDTHVGLMEDQSVLDTILGIIKPRTISPYNNTQPNIQPLKMQDFDITIKKIKDKQLTMDDQAAKDAAFWRKMWEVTAK